MAAAASSGKQSVEIMDALHEAGAEVNASGGIHGTALLAAASPLSFQSEEKILKLIGWGADPDLPGPNGTFGQIAARHPNPKVRGMVLAYEEPSRSHYYREALMAAAASGTIETMISLIEQGVDVNAEANFLGSISTPLAAAVSSHTEDNFQKAQLLLMHGANANVATIGYSNILQMYLDCKDPNPLLAKALLDSGIDVNAPSGPAGHSTAVEIALQHYQQEEKGMWIIWQDIIMQLHRGGAILNDEDFETLLQYPWFIEGLTIDPKEVDVPGLEYSVPYPAALTFI